VNFDICMQPIEGHWAVTQKCSTSPATIAAGGLDPKINPGWHHPSGVLWLPGLWVWSVCLLVVLCLIISGPELN